MIIQGEYLLTISIVRNPVLIHGLAINIVIEHAKYLAQMKPSNSPHFESRLLIVVWMVVTVVFRMSIVKFLGLL